MQAVDLCALLERNPYPGRGVLLGMGPAEQRVALYFIMGRSENSRNRVFLREEDAFQIAPFDPDKVADPSLILYHPMRTHQGAVVLTNGDQTDTVLEHLREDSTFEAALRTRRFEPDAPHYTPRISGLQQLESGHYTLSILKSMGGGVSCQRHFFEYEPQRGVGHFIHTYAGDGDPLPSFQGEPVAVTLPDDLDAYAQQVWHSLHGENRVALFCRATDAQGRVLSLKVFNRHQNKEEA